MIAHFAPRRSHSEKKIRISHDKAEKITFKRINDGKLRDMIVESKRIGGRVINVFNIVRNGLKYDLKQSYFIIEN